MGSSPQQQGSGGSTGGRRMGVAQPEVGCGEADDAADGSDGLDMDLPQSALEARYDRAAPRRRRDGPRPSLRVGRDSHALDARQTCSADGSAQPHGPCCVRPLPKLSFALMNQPWRCAVAPPVPRPQSASHITVGQPVRSVRPGGRTTAPVPCTQRVLACQRGPLLRLEGARQARSQRHRARPGATGLAVPAEPSGRHTRSDPRGHRDDRRLVELRPAYPGLLAAGRSTGVCPPSSEPTW